MQEINGPRPRGDRRGDRRREGRSAAVPGRLPDRDRTRRPRLRGPARGHSASFPGRWRRPWRNASAGPAALSKPRRRSPPRGGRPPRRARRHARFGGGTGVAGAGGEGRIGTADRKAGCRRSWRAAIGAYKAVWQRRGIPILSIQASGDISEHCTRWRRRSWLVAPTSKHQPTTSATSPLDAGGDGASRLCPCRFRAGHAMMAANGIAAHGSVIPLAVTCAFSELRTAGDAHGGADRGCRGTFVFSSSIRHRRPGAPPASRDAGRPARHAQHAGHAARRRGGSRRVLGDRPGTWSGPVSLVFTARRCRRFARDGGPENRSRRGAYVLAEAEGAARRVTLLWTGWR